MFLPNKRVVIANRKDLELALAIFDRELMSQAVGLANSVITIDGDLALSVEVCSGSELIQDRQYLRPTSQHYDWFVSFGFASIDNDCSIGDE